MLLVAAWVGADSLRAHPAAVCPPRPEPRSSAEHRHPGHASSSCPAPHHFPNTRRSGPISPVCGSLHRCMPLPPPFPLSQLAGQLPWPLACCNNSSLAPCIGGRALWQVGSVPARLPVWPLASAAPAARSALGWRGRAGPAGPAAAACPVSRAPRQRRPHSWVVPWLAGGARDVMVVGGAWPGGV